jgi:hypothetical protein
VDGGGKGRAPASFGGKHADPFRRLGLTFIWRMSVDSAFFDLIVCHQLSEMVFDRNRRRKTEFASKPKRVHLGLLR